MGRMPSVPGDILSDFFGKARSVVIAAPYIKANALNLLLSKAEPLVSIICVTRWRPDDLVAGVSDIDCRALITERDGSFKIHSSLHAKYYRFDDTVFVGSANLTSSAMGWTSQPNLEILCRAGGDFDANGFEEDILQTSREISDTEFACWEKLMEIGAGGYNAISAIHPSLDTWRPATRDLRNLEIAYQGREEEIAAVDERRAALRDIQALSMSPGLTEAAVRAWISTCLLATPFANSVMRLSDMDTQRAAATLAATYQLNVTKARRDMETVQNWLSFLALTA